MALVVAGAAAALTQLARRAGAPGPVAAAIGAAVAAGANLTYQYAQHGRDQGDRGRCCSGRRGRAVSPRRSGGACGRVSARCSRYSLAPIVLVLSSGGAPVRAARVALTVAAFSSAPKRPPLRAALLAAAVGLVAAGRGRRPCPTSSPPRVRRRRRSSRPSAGGTARGRRRPSATSSGRCRPIRRRASGSAGTTASPVAGGHRQRPGRAHRADPRARRARSPWPSSRSAGSARRCSSATARWPRVLVAAAALARTRTRSCSWSLAPAVVLCAGLGMWELWRRRRGRGARGRGRARRRRAAAAVLCVGRDRDPRGALAPTDRMEALEDAADHARRRLLAASTSGRSTRSTSRAPSATTRAGFRVARRRRRCARPGRSSATTSTSTSRRSSSSSASTGSSCGAAPVASRPPSDFAARLPERLLRGLAPRPPVGVRDHLPAGRLYDADAGAELRRGPRARRAGPSRRRRARRRAARPERPDDGRDDPGRPARRLGAGSDHAAGMVHPHTPGRLDGTIRTADAGRYRAWLQLSHRPADARCGSTAARSAARTRSTPRSSGCRPASCAWRRAATGSSSSARGGRPLPGGRLQRPARAARARAGRRRASALERVAPPRRASGCASSRWDWVEAVER